MHDVVSCLTVAVALGLVGAAQAQESPALTEARELCLANHAKADKALAAADSAGWTTPAGPQAEGTRIQNFSGLRRTLVAKAMSSPLPDGGLIHVDFCGVMTAVAAGDVKGAAKSLMGDRAPIVDDDGGWQGLFTGSGPSRHFLIDKRQETITPGLQEGPVFELAAGSGPGGDSVIYIEMRRTAK
jgi:hypothetical protein